MKWKCTKCSYTHLDFYPLKGCPICGANKENLEKIENGQKENSEKRTS